MTSLALTPATFMNGARTRIRNRWRWFLASKTSVSNATRLLKRNILLLPPQGLLGPWHINCSWTPIIHTGFKTSQHPRGKPFRREQGKQSSYKDLPSSSNKRQPYIKNKKSASQQSRHSGNNQSSRQNSNRRNQYKPSQQGQSFFKKGRGGGGNYCRK